MKFIISALRIAKLVLTLLFEFIRLSYAFRKGRRAFRRSLLREELPDPLVRELLREYSSMKKQPMRILR